MDTSLFYYTHNNTSLFVLVYVDDIIVTGSNNSLVTSFIATLGQRFSLKDLGSLNYFLGVEVQPTTNGLALSQRKYITDILGRANMSDATPAHTPLDAHTPLVLDDGTPLLEPTDFRALVGSLQYLSLTRPDVGFAVNKLSQFMHRPTTVHWQALKRLLRYLKGTLDYCLHLYSNSPPILHAFFNSDWAGNRDDYTSTGAYIVYLGKNAISWSSRKQKTVARSSTEAEYRSVAQTAAELEWVQHLLHELQVQYHSPPVIYCDNIGATKLSANPVFQSRMKHLGVDYHFIRERVQSGSLRVTTIHNDDQLADILTKSLARPRLQMLINKLGLTAR